MTAEEGRSCAGSKVCGSRRKLPDGKYTPWTQRRCQWQRPFWKGDGTILQHIYKLQDGEKEKEMVFERILSDQELKT